jgi:hypothetical protein
LLGDSVSPGRRPAPSRGLSALQPPRGPGPPTEQLRGTGVVWSPYRKLNETFPELTAGTLPTITARDDDGIGRNIATTGPIHAGGQTAAPPAAPTLGAHTSEIRTEILGTAPDR